MARSGNKRRLHRWLIGILVLLSAPLLFFTWPFIAYPVADIHIDKPVVDPIPAPEQPQAALAMVDITPPIGIPKFGYSSFARSSDGFRTRLKARVLVLHAPNDQPMALVAADLGGGSRILHHRIAEHIARQTPIAAHRLSLLTTHTHAGPGQFLDSNFYNVFGSNQPGFDPQLTEFLAQQIADAIITAWQQRRPARIAIGQEEIWGLTRNRSLEAWAQNFDIPEHQLDETLALRAVNPMLSLLRVDLQSDDGQYYPAGAFTAFSIHGTAIPAFTHPWHADIWAWLARDVETAIKQDYESPFEPVHGAYQATHADNNPAWAHELRGDREARRIGQSLANKALELFEQLDEQLTDDVTTAMGTRQLDLLSLTDNQRFTLCERPVAGASVVGAANGDEVFPISWIPLIQHGWPRHYFTEGCHGVKHWMLSKLQLLIPKHYFPHVALFQVFRINDLIIVALPWEVTLEAGNHIRRTVIANLPPGDWRVEISSVANSFFGYATTAEEYSVQYYEGGHTLYGPGTTDFIAQHSASLARDTLTATDLDELPDHWHFSLIKSDFWPEAKGDKATRETLTLPRFYRGTTTEEPYFEFQFRGETPGHMTLSDPLLSIEINEGNGWHSLASKGIPMDDESNQLQLKLLRKNDQHAEYAVRWFNPTHVSSDALLRFRVGGNHEVLYSDPFR